MRIRLFCGVLVALWVSSASAQEPKPIRLWLTPARPPTPALRYQLLPDARVARSGNAADVYNKIVELLAKKPLNSEAQALSEITEQPLSQVATADLRKTLAVYDDVYDLLDEAARCERCDWGLRDRLREKGIGTLLPEVQKMRECALLLSVRVRLEMAEGRFDKAAITLRNGFALARNLGDAETLINFLVGIAIAAIMEKQLDTFIAQPEAPNLYYALTELPAPFLSMRKPLQGEYLGVYGTFPTLREAATDLNAGPLSEEELARYKNLLAGLSRGNEIIPFNTYAGHVLLAWNIRNKHEAAKQALIDAGRPRDKVEAMPPMQVALLHAFLEYDAAIDNLRVAQERPYWELSEYLASANKIYLRDRWKNPTAAAVPLVPLMMPAIEKVSLARGRNDRKIALLRTIEALRFYAATHDGKLPRALALVKEVPVPLDPLTGKSFEYQLDGDLAKLRAPAPADQKPNLSNVVIYEMKMRK